MVSQNRIAEEIYSLFLTQNYCEYVQCLHDCDVVNCSLFQELTLGKIYWLDTRNTLLNGRANPDHMFQLFRKFSDEDPDCVRQCMIDIILEEPSKWQCAGHVSLQLNLLNIGEWCELMKQPHVSCDKLMLYVLSVVHSRHTIVYTAKCILTTINNINSLSVPELHSVCDVHLVFLGNHMYGKLKHHPLLTAPLPIHSPPMILGRSTQKLQNTVPLDLRVSTTDNADAIATCNKSPKMDSSRIIELFEK